MPSVLFKPFSSFPACSGILGKIQTGSSQLNLKVQVKKKVVMTKTAVQVHSNFYTVSMRALSGNFMIVNTKKCPEKISIHEISRKYNRF